MRHVLPGPFPAAGPLFPVLDLRPGLCYLTLMDPDMGADVLDFYTFIHRRLPPAPIVEVGVWLARSLLHLASLLRTAGLSSSYPLFGVDTFNGGPSATPEMLERVRAAGGSLYLEVLRLVRFAGFAREINLLELPSLGAAPLFKNGECGLVFIDAAHTYDEVKQDILVWRPKIISGGVLAGHDYDDTYPGVQAAVHETLGPVNLLNHCWYIFNG